MKFDWKPERTGLICEMLHARKDMERIMGVVLLQVSLARSLKKMEALSCPKA